MPSGDQPRRLSLLLVDDHPDFRAMLKAALERREFDVCDAATTSAALQILAERDGFDVIVTDANIEGRHDGLGVVRWAVSQHPERPVIVITGCRDVDAAARVAGAVRILHKPLSAAHLARTIFDVSGAAYGASSEA